MITPQQLTDAAADVARPAKEVAAELGISRQRLYQLWARAGITRPRRVLREGCRVCGKRLWVDPSSRTAATPAPWRGVCRACRKLLHDPERRNQVKMAYLNRLYAKRKTLGVCIRCGAPLAPISIQQCDRHLEQQRARQHRYALRVGQP